MVTEIKIVVAYKMGRVGTDWKRPHGNFEE